MRIENRIAALEARRWQHGRPANMDLSKLTDEDVAFLEQVGAKIPAMADTDKPDLTAFTDEELERLLSIYWG